MDIIKEAVLHIERNVPARDVDEHSHGAHAVGRLFADDFPDRDSRPSEELARLRIYHSSMRDERIHDAFTNLRTHAIQRTGKRSCSIVVTALAPHGGASFVALNLAAAFASDSSGSAILADCNFAGSRYRQLGDSNTGVGITDYIDGSVTSITELMTNVGIPRLRLLGGGTSRSTQREYFTRPQARSMFLELGKRYDDCAVVVDAPPVLSSANVSVIANYCDAVLLVVPYGKTTQQDVRAAVRSIPSDKLLGSVFNDIPHWRVTG